MNEEMRRTVRRQVRRLAGSDAVRIIEAQSAAITGLQLDIDNLKTRVGMLEHPHQPLTWRQRWQAFLEGRWFGYGA